MTATPGRADGGSHDPQRARATTRRIVLYMKDGPESGSSYYRLLQYLPHMRGDHTSIKVRVLAPRRLEEARRGIVGNSRAGVAKRLLVRLAYTVASTIRGIGYFSVDLAQGLDTLIVLRSLFPRAFPLVEPLYSALLRHSRLAVWDFDDDILANREICSREFSTLASSVDAIVVTHATLRDQLPIAARQKVRLLPTTDGDFAMDPGIQAKRCSTLGQEVRLVWVASSSGLADLESVAEALDAAARAVHLETNRRLSLEVVCNLPLEHQFTHLRLVNTPWSRPAAVAAMASAHVGIMPLIDSRFARGKGAFKLVQYMASGLPSIASAVGYNQDVIQHSITGFLVPPAAKDAWTVAILAVSRTCDEWLQMSQDAHQKWLRDFSFARNAEFWSRITKGDDSWVHERK